MKDGACTHEEKPLEHGMIQGVVESGNERQSCEHREVVGCEKHGKPNTDQYYTYVLHRVVGKKPREGVLHKGVKNPQNRGDQAQDQDNPAPPPGKYLEKIEYN